MRMMHLFYAAIGFAVARWIFKRQASSRSRHTVSVAGSSVERFSQAWARAPLRLHFVSAHAHCYFPPEVTVTKVCPHSSLFLPLSIQLAQGRSRAFVRRAAPAIPSELCMQGPRTMRSIRLAMLLVLLCLRLRAHRIVRGRLQRRSRSHLRGQLRSFCRTSIQALI